jgi:hypothetical protein
MAPVPYIAPRTRLPFTHNDVYALRASLRAFWDKCAALRKDESTVMVAIEIVCCMRGTVALLRAMLYVPGGRGMAALIRPGGYVLV